MLNVLFLFPMFFLVSEGAFSAVFLGGGHIVEEGSNQGCEGSDCANLERRDNYSCPLVLIHP